MRLLYVTESFPYGSGESFLGPEIRQLISAGDDLRVLPLRPVGNIRSEARDLERITLGPGSTWGAFSTLATRFDRVGALGSLLGRFREVGSARKLAWNLAATWRALQAVRFLHEWRPAHIHVHWANYTATMGMVLAEILDVEWSLTAHRYDIVANNLLRAKLNSAKFARFISNSGLRIATDLLGPEIKSTCRVIHMGVPLRASREAAGRQDVRFVLLCPANLVPVKGHRILLRAFKLLVDRGIPIELLLAGEGPERPEIEAYVRDSGIATRVSILGHVPQGTIQNWYETQSVDAVVLPSLDLGNGLHEGIPVSLMEAMSFGIPVVSTTTGGIPELLGGEAGLLVPPGDAKSLAQALETLATDPAIRLRIGVRGQEVVSARFSIRTTVEQLRRLVDPGSVGGEDSSTSPDFER